VLLKSGTLMTTITSTARLACLLAGASAIMLAQSHGYLSFGPGGATSDGHTSGAMYMGGGGELISRIGLGGGAEVGYTTPWRSFRSGIGIASANGSFHFNRSGSVVPFVTGGYTLFFRSGHANGFNAGAGVNWWLSHRIGLKVEVRDHVGLGRFNDVQLWAVRAGITFR
jgi:hypothetical protein